MSNKRHVLKPVIYQMLPRLFGNTNAHCQPFGDIEHNGCGKFNDISASILESLVDMGITHVWYTGVIRHATQTDYSAFGIPRNNPNVVKGKAGSPYAIVDYYDVDPDLAMNVDCRFQEFEQLIERTHAAGLKVIIDFVPNHVAREYHSMAKPDGVEDLGSNDDTQKFFDPNNNFYYLTDQHYCPTKGCGDYVEFPAKATGNDCYSATPSEYDWYETVKINYGIDPWSGCKHFEPIPDTWHKMLQIMDFWASLGIDGLRCDMAHMVPVEFWHWAIGILRNKFPHLIFVAEIYDVSLYDSYINYGGFDYLYDKVTLYDKLVNILINNESSSTLTSCWQTVNPWRAHLLHFMENHDEVRLASKHFCGDARRAWPAVVVSALIDTGPMMVFNGQELGEKGDEAEGYRGDDGRTSIFDYWSMSTVRHWLGSGDLEQSHPIRDCYKKLLRICNHECAIAHGEMFDLMYVNPHLNRQYAFLRHDGNELLLIVTNFSDVTCETNIHIPSHAVDFLHLPCGNFSSKELLHDAAAMIEICHERDIQVSVRGYDAVVWKIFLK